MKEHWEYKKLGEICEIKAGYTPKSDEISYIGDIPYFKVGDMNSEGNEIYLHKTNSYLSKDAKYFPKNSIVFPKNGAAIATNKKRILSQPSIVDLNTAVLIPDVTQNVKFLFYFLNNIDFKDITRGGAIPTLDLKELKLHEIPYLNLEEQKRIVEELDLLSGIIEKQKQQLKELDTLAQSIFYDMFGNPIINEKGWEVKKLGEVSINLDSYRKPVTKADRQPGPYPYYGASGIVDYVSNFIFDGIYLLVSEDGANLLTRNQPIAFLSYGKVWINNHAHVLDFKDHSSKIYLMFYLNLLDLKDKVKGAAQPKLTQKDLNDINLSWPALNLQNLFASKIEAIEKQKDAITKSIEETQKLFDYTMDKYFG